MRLTGIAKVYDHDKAVWTDVHCELTVYTADIIQRLGVKAARSKSKRSKVLNGLVKVRVMDPTTS
jgi:hypothetical protein